MKLIFKYFFISLLFLNGQLVHAQSFKIDSLKGKKWELQLPKGKSYTSSLIFKDRHTQLVSPLMDRLIL